jgi:chemotaxis protein methyltransferase CheR
MRQTPHTLPDELVGDPSYSRLKEYLIESTGLAYYRDKDADLARRIRRRLSDLRFLDCASYLDLLRDRGRGPVEMDALIEEITIGESYFFRHREHFDALRDLVLPDLVARNAGSQRLSIWSAGCADGAEPYSLSILLRKELSHLLLGWEVSILGTDINRQYLAIARRGLYEHWSLRSTSEQLRRDCFEEKEKHWTIAPEYREGLSFQFHNLVEESFPSQPNHHFDLIVCRNVMIYFGSTLMRSIIRRFHDCLTAGGWLLVGPSEPNMTHFTSFRVVNAPGTTLYQKPAPSTLALSEPIAFPNLPPSIVLTPAVSLPGNSEIRPASRSAISLPGHSEIRPAIPMTDSVISALADLRKRADLGDWESAARCARALIERDNLNALAHFHYGLVLEQLGNYAESEQALRRAIYLDRQAILAHYHLGLLLRSRGHLRQAERCFNNALNLLAAMAGDEILANADGITALELKKMTHMQIESVRGQA